MINYVNKNLIDHNFLLKSRRHRLTYLNSSSKTEGRLFDSGGE